MYIVRRKGWSVWPAMTMGLEGYRHRMPTIEQRPSYIPESCVKDKEMPKGALERALARRDAWIVGYLGGVTQKLVTIVDTASDITSLLRDVEADQSLVHAAYYTDDECIAQVADWIAGRG